MTTASTRRSCGSDDAPATTTSWGRHEFGIGRFLAVANSIGDDDLGVASADDLLEGRGPRVASSVGDDDGRSGQLVAVGEQGDPLALEHGAPAPVELAGLPTLDGRLARVGPEDLVGLGRRLGRVGPGGVAGLEVGELLDEALLDQASQPGGDVDGFFLPESVETSPHQGVDPEADAHLVAIERALAKLGARGAGDAD